MIGYGRLHPLNATQNGISNSSRPAQSLNRAVAATTPLQPPADVKLDRRAGGESKRYASVVNPLTQKKTTRTEKRIHIALESKGHLLALNTVSTSSALRMRSLDASSSSLEGAFRNQDRRAESAPTESRLFKESIVNDFSLDAKAKEKGVTLASYTNDVELHVTDETRNRMSGLFITDTDGQPERAAQVDLPEEEGSAQPAELPSIP